MRGMIRRAMMVAGPAVVLLGLTAGTASASGAAASWSPATSPGTFSYNSAFNNGQPVNPGQTFSQKFTLKNSGSSATSALTITLTPSPAFAASHDACTGTSLGPGKSCTITVTYTAPNAPGQTQQATLTVTSPKPSATAARLTLTGTVANAAATSLLVSAPAGFPAGLPTPFVVEALDASHNVVTGYTGTVHFTSTDPQAQLPADSTLTNGVGNFLMILIKAGNQTVTATDTINSGITGATTVTVVPAPAVTLLVGGPGSVTAGAPASVTVTALDQFGNVATGYTGTVHFTSTDPIAQLPTDSTLTNGAGTFPVTLKTAGPQTVTATDTVHSTITGTSGPVMVNPAAAAGFLITGPAGTMAGLGAPYTVTAKDQFGNVATGYTGTVHFTTSADPSAMLPADYTFTAADNGVHTDFFVTFETAVPQMLCATDTVNSGIGGCISVAVE